MRRFLAITAVLLAAFFLPFIVIRADELDDITKQLEQLKKDLSDKEANHSKLNEQLNGIRSRVTFLENEIVKKEQEVVVGEKALAKQVNLLNARTKNYYKNINKNAISLVNLLVSENLSESLNNFFYQRVLVDQDRAAIVKIVLYIRGLENKKEELKRERTWLAGVKAEIDKQSVVLAGEINLTKKKISELSAKQEAILSARSGTVITSVGSVPTGSDPAASIAYKSSAPGGSFAAFSFGAYTHRNGMSQYGAKAQADGGKPYQEIIQWYYGKGVRKDDGMPETINVEGYGEMSFQTYLYGIAEMPSSWNKEALKAQAVAARTYATRANKPICTSERCQVFLKSKSDNPPAEWKTAVDETNKEVIDGDVSSQYSSTAGGYLNTSGWDTTDRTNSGDWTSRAWESIAGSPWFYKAWYRQSYSDSSNSCGRAHPWLSQAEFADIINAWIVRKNPNGADTGRIVPVTINDCPIGGVSGSPYSLDELRNAANNSGGAVTSVSSARTENNGSGQTTTVFVGTNRGELAIPGSEFKTTFNIRAPGYISIPQSGFAFFNIESN